MNQEMKYCMECGAKLEMRPLKDEGIVPYCPHCGVYRFPVFNVAVSMIVTNEKEDQILLIKQYGRNTYILVAGYVNKGEDAEHAVVREVKEEMNLDVHQVRFNHSHYFAKSNTLMLNFTAIVDGHVHPNWEIDSYHWFSREEARKNIRPNSLAEAFLVGYLDGTYHF
ncbi:MAG: NUDIX domain-containing protein [Absicoccus sp.]|jgi:NAD+ diphosphatase|uniref:NAD(+) diphosphatase n=1 Tax=Absicoccus TaxID=2718525 RepID=UPI00240A8CD4|nr:MULTISPECIES: NUDIX domain-containing protein [Absicoccus]MDD6460849.1 NUDIX domain-containing protein [Absicoccus porci]MDY3035884.1 NUDIX domain-containing protein [Absicoccus sp.]